MFLHSVVRKFKSMGSKQIGTEFCVYHLETNNLYKLVIKIIDLTPDTHTHTHSVISAPFPVEAGSLTAQALLSDQTVQLVFYVEGMRRCGLVFGAGVLLKEQVGQGLFCCQTIHGVKGQNTLQKVHSCVEEKG